MSKTYKAVGCSIDAHEENVRTGAERIGSVPVDVSTVWVHLVTRDGRRKDVITIGVNLDIFDNDNSKFTSKIK